MNSNFRAKLDAAERAGYLPALRAQARLMCVPFWWHGHGNDGLYQILRNGTVCFVDTGVRKLAVTADHVLEQYLTDLKRDGSITCQFGSSTVDLAARILARDARLDLATLEMSEVLVGPTGGAFHSPRAWPTAVVAVGDVLLCGGYPGKLRNEHAATADFLFQWFIGRATDVSDHNIAMTVDFEDMHVPAGSTATLNRVIGGMSGGPVFRFVPGPIEHLEQVGVVYQHQESYKLLLARPVRAIHPDGSLATAEGAA